MHLQLRWRCQSRRLRGVLRCLRNEHNETHVKMTNHCASPWKQKEFTMATNARPAIGALPVWRSHHSTSRNKFSRAQLQTFFLPQLDTHPRIRDPKLKKSHHTARLIFFYIMPSSRSPFHFFFSFFFMSTILQYASPPTIHLSSTAILAASLCTPTNNLCRRIISIVFDLLLVP